MKRITFHPDAELTEAARYYESCQPGLGSDLLAEVESALDQILSNPEASQKIASRVRRKFLWRFPLHSDIRGLSGKNTNRCVRSPKAAAFLLAKAAKEDTGEVVPGHVISNMPELRHQEVIRSGF